MNVWQIAGGIISIFGTAVMFYGSWLQSKGDRLFQEKVINHVEKQIEADIPELVALKAQLSGSTLILNVKNIGRQPAQKVTLVFREDSFPSAFVSNDLPGATEISPSVERVFKSNIFSGINRLLSLPNAEPGYLTNLELDLNKFKSGKVALIPRFHFEYYFGERKFKSRVYFLVIDFKRGLVNFGQGD